ncbi:nudix hydrolase 15, mitochondrial-like isoform X1 [Syzygium oleosum]|uniref:nudix hydrolase 15, mitochondrial-like isoform X1 n=1 Tax=Syzygium oleosum TaxID=219896 RepID=UPI0024BADD0F|nr:nudix hydrolase 15, mitochondrial-like isoform X1 [Syzygium oleosum]
MGNLSGVASETLRELANRLRLCELSLGLEVDHEEKNSDLFTNSKDGPNDQSQCAQDDDCCCPIKPRRKRRAAVLVCLFEGHGGELRVILTKRSMKLSSYPETGDVALPGGKMEEHDKDDTATALREATEEIGLDPELVQVVANLEPFFSQHLFEVVPVIGLLAKIEDFTPSLNVDEVDVVFDVPLEMFLKEENHRCEEREWLGWKYILHVFDYQPERETFCICGLTARILIRVASVVFQRPPSFDLHTPDFRQLQLVLEDIRQNLKVGAATS